MEPTGAPNVDSADKTIGNYKLQYLALKEKFRKFPNTKFILWTGAALVKSATTEKEALKAKDFFDWVVKGWDEKGDNIFIWDFYEYETEGELYIKDKYAEGPFNSHPNREFSARISPLFSRFIIDVINGFSQK